MKYICGHDFTPEDAMTRILCIWWLTRHNELRSIRQERLPRGAPQASEYKRKHRNCFQTRPLQAAWAYPKKYTSLGSEVSWYDQTRAYFQLHRSTCSASPISTQKEPFPRSEFPLALNLDILDAARSPNAGWNYTGGFRSWPPATCRFSTRRSFDHHGKGNDNFV